MQASPVLLPKESFVDIPDGRGGQRPLLIHCIAAVPETERADNVRVNIERKTLRLMELPGLLCARNEPLAIVAGGPSVKDHLDEIRKFKQVMVCGSAHDYLIDQGIVASFAVIVDPMANTVEFYKNAHKDTSYLVASQCNPNIFDLLEEFPKVAMWHFAGQVDDKSVFKGEREIAWGCMVTINSMQIALYLGFQDLHFFGLDCSLTPEETHAYDVGSKEIGDMRSGMVPVTVNGENFITTTALMAQAAHFFNVFQSPDGAYLKAKVYGDGMLASIVRNSPPEMKQWVEAR